MVSFGYLREKCYLCSDIYKIAKDMENLHKTKSVTVRQMSGIRFTDNQDEPEYDPQRWGETGTTSKEPTKQA